MENTISHEELVTALSQSVGVTKARDILEDAADSTGIPIKDNYTTAEINRVCDAIKRDNDGYMEIIADEFKIQTRAKKRSHALFENIPDAAVVLAYDQQTPIVRAVNSAFSTVFGYDEEQIRDESLNEFIVPDGHSDEAEDIDRQVVAGEQVEREVKRETEDGEVRDFLFRTVPMEKTTGELEAYSIYTDVTDRRQRTRELREHNKRLEEVTTVVTHDLRNPLSIAQSHLSFAMEDLDESLDGYEFLRDVEDAIERMERLSEDLLTLARHGKRVTETQSVDFSEVSQQAWADTDSSGGELVIETSGNIEADEGQLNTLLGHLFQNAITHAGPNVTVTVGTTTDGFYVHDDGPGIAAEKQNKVLEYGYTTETGGTGLGLSIVRSIVTAHGWDIKLTESNTGGVRFDITDVTVQ